MDTFKKYLRPLVLIVLLVGLLGGAYYLYQNQDSTNKAPTSRKVERQVITLNKSFEYPVSNTDTSLSPLKVTFVTAQLTNRILVSRKPQYARSGTKYLMLNLLLENENTKRINFKTRDIVRLIDNNGKKFAPSYFNKTVAVEGDSAKKDVVGFLVPIDIKNFKIQYGPLAGSKQTLELKFK
ncbi:hypothetical protein HYS91_00355 [Candidatus Daviesbacteria bacterium]|nr:hypothetical protein [Candidatus Daviesbacteria bacterium]